jgi:hypothetical protein
MAREAVFIIGRAPRCPSGVGGAGNASEYPLDAVGKLAGRRDARLRGAAAAQHEHLGRKRIEHPRAVRRPGCVPTPFSKTW